MRILVDGFFRVATRESSKALKIKQIRSWYDGVITQENRRVIPEMICQQFGFSLVSEESLGHYDIVIDTDTDRIYQPRY